MNLIGGRRKKLAVVSFEEGLDRTVRWFQEHTEWVRRVRSGAYREWISQNYGER